MHAHPRFMGMALSWGRRNLGRTWPNPSVGAVVVRDGQVLAAAVTAPGGRPHAEPQALAQAGARAHGATLYVTLEPCAHDGKTPPCADAIIQAGIRCCVVACRDPNPRVNGQGIARLRAAGIEVIEGIGEAEARAGHAGFFSVIERKRPFVSVKIATSLDGKIAHPPGGERWITGERARQYGHWLRAHHDAIATGIGTVLADDPLLTCRLPGLEDRSPVRVVFDRNGRLPEGCKLLQTAQDVPVWVTAEEIEQALSGLAARGITRLLVEGGARLTTAFLNSGLVDRLYWFRAPLVIGGEGLAAIHGALPGMARVTQERTLALGEDHLDIYRATLHP